MLLHEIDKSTIHPFCVDGRKNNAKGANKHININTISVMCVVFGANSELANSVRACFMARTIVKRSETGTATTKNIIAIAISISIKSKKSVIYPKKKRSII